MHLFKYNVVAFIYPTNRFKKAYQFKQKLLGLWGRMTVFQNIFFTLKEFRLKRQLKYNLLDEIYSDFTEEMDRIKNFLQR